MVYNNPSCQYDQTNVDATPLLQSLDAWTSSVPPELSIVFWGLPAAPDAAPGGGYIPPNDLISKVLPHIEETCSTHSCGGFMLWDRFHDIESNYSNQVKHWDEQSACRFVTQVSKASLGSVSTT
ncbi:acidic endochitinase-like [Medicago truncatula]|uniref:acidic endochitinase-like n=1 Tax=Medicago truncatula TaxID=3880 RepID=UPI001967F7FA|nr:acidic endochitinase-like [Medicago truncatula]